MKVCPGCLVCLDDAVADCPYDGTSLETAFEGVAIIDGKYHLERCLGTGGMGTVYRARHLGLDRRFALKLIRSPHAGRTALVDRFEIEAKALGKLKHPNIVDVTDYGVDTRGAGLPYLVMEYLEGTTLQAFCRDMGAVPVDRALPLLDSIASAVDYAHEHGVLHRDLKPANVFLAEHGAKTQTVKILDFGLARLVEESVLQMGVSTLNAESPTKTRPATLFQGNLHQREAQNFSEGDTASQFSGPVVALPNPVTPKETLAGTLAYMAPEVIRGQEATPASDRYAFGVLIFEVIVGRLPFTGTPLDISVGHRESLPPSPSTLGPSLPPELDRPLLAPLEKHPARRPRRAVDIVEAVRSAWQCAERKRWQAREIPRRLRLSGVLAPVIVVVSALLGGFGPVRELERRTVDARFASQPRRLPDPRIIVVSVDEATLAADPTPLADKADEFGRELERVFAAGARGVAIDFLLPERWNRSQAFSTLVLRHAENLILAVFSSPSGRDGRYGMRGRARRGSPRTHPCRGALRLRQPGRGQRWCHPPGTLALSGPRRGETRLVGGAGRQIPCGSHAPRFRVRLQAVLDRPLD